MKHLVVRTGNKTKKKILKDTQLKLEEQRRRVCETFRL